LCVVYQVKAIFIIFLAKKALIFTKNTYFDFCWGLRYFMPDMGKEQVKMAFSLHIND